MDESERSVADTSGLSERESEERRFFSWRTVTYGFTFSRRRAHRRFVDTEVIFLDWHHPWLFFLSVGTMLFSCADAFLTLQLIDRGMIEFELGQALQALAEHSTRFRLRLIEPRPCVPLRVVLITPRHLPLAVLDPLAGDVFSMPSVDSHRG